MAIVAPAQRLSFGVVAGGYATPDFIPGPPTDIPGLEPGRLKPDGGGFLLGPSLSVRLWGDWQLGAEALYKLLGYRAPNTWLYGRLIGYERASVVTWQFPVLLRRSLTLGGTRMFMEGGPSFRTAGNLNAADPSHVGVSAGAGLEFGWGRWRVEPGVRYTRWARDGCRPFCVETRPDQVELLARAGYLPASNLHPLGPRIRLGGVLSTTVTERIQRVSYTGIYEPYQTLFTHETTSGLRRWEIGPLIEVLLSDRLSIEGSAVSRSSYSRIRATVGPWEGFTWTSSYAEPWEFPVLVKYRMTAGRRRPFAALGPAFRLPQGPSGRWLAIYGAAAELGLEMRLGGLCLSPAVRYTRWGPDRQPAPGVKVSSGVPANRVQLVLGVTF